MDSEGCHRLTSLLNCPYVVLALRRSIIISWVCNTAIRLDDVGKMLLHRHGAGESFGYRDNEHSQFQVSEDNEKRADSLTR
jgi:hypothetical protein